MTDEEKTFLIMRAESRCEYCKCLLKYSPQPFTVDHVVPIASGGTNDLDNLALACGGCNGYKYTKTKAKDSVTGHWVSLFHPRKAIWSDHFVWDATCVYILGITATGRATVDALKLNREGLVNLREITKLTGEHPP